MNLLQKLIDLEQDAQKFGFDWPDHLMILDQIMDECREVREEIDQGSHKEKLQEEIGDLLHSVISLCIFSGFDVGETISKTNVKFSRRMQLLKTLTKQKGLEHLQGQSIDLMLDLWKDVKKMEHSSGIDCVYNARINSHERCAMKPSIHMITLATKDLNKATKFYEEGLGFPKMNFEGNISFFMLHGSWLSLYPWELLAQDARMEDASFGFRGMTLAHNVPHEHQVIEILEQAKNAGARIVKQAQKTEWGGFSGYFTDLDGHLWEIAHNPFFWPGPKDEDGLGVQ